MIEFELVLTGWHSSGLAWYYDFSSRTIVAIRRACVARLRYMSLRMVSVFAALQGREFVFDACGSCLQPI